jgi:hypothetical protein
MMTIRKYLLIVPLLFATILPATAQYRDHQDDRQISRFNSGVRSGGRGGNYYDPHYDNRGYQDRNRRDQGGIGPGKGALIGAGGGAILGALFGGGLKGTIIGGAAGAGIGAVVGEAHQNSRRDDYRDRRR